jgi:hypothetical protein
MRFHWARRQHGAARHRRRMGAVALAVMVASMVTGLALASPALADVSGNITGPGGKCIDITAGATWNGARLQLWTCNGEPWQEWIAQDDGTIHSGTGKCMDVSGGGTADGTAVQSWDCNGTGAQQWVRMDGILFNPQSGKCLDATGGGSADGTPLQIWDCNGTWAQHWTVSLNTTITLPPGGGWAEVHQGSFCLDTGGGGGPLKMSSCHGYASNGGPQRWIFTHLSDDSYLISNQANSLCVTARAGSGPRGLLIQQTCDQPNQAWWIIPSGFSAEVFKLQSTSLPNVCMSSFGGPTWSSCFASSLDDQYDQLWGLA